MLASSPMRRGIEERNVANVRSLCVNPMQSKRGFTLFYEANVGAVFRFVHHRVPNGMVAEDLVSEVFYKAWRSRHSFEPGTNAQAWVFRIARNTIIDYWRRAKDAPLEHEEMIVSEDMTPVLALERQETHRQLWRAVGTLPRQMQLVVLLRFIDELPAREVGTRLGLSEGNVRIIQLRALRRLRDIMKAWNY